MRTNYSSGIENFEYLGTYRMYYEQWLDDNIRDSKLKDFLGEEENVSSEQFIIDVGGEVPTKELIQRAKDGYYTIMRNCTYYKEIDDMKLSKKQKDFIQACGDCGVNPTWKQVKAIEEKETKDEGSDLFMTEVYGGK